MAEMHFFDIQIAKKYGINCAVILQNIWYWVRKNEANETNYYDGNYWTYNSTKAFKELFPYLSQKQIETALKKLRDEGIIETGNYNAVKYDRTLWYAVTEKGKSILQNGCDAFDEKGKCILPVGEMHLTKEGNGFDSEVKPIPNINPNSKTKDLKTSDDKPYKEIIDYLNGKANTHYKSTTDKTRSCINARLQDGFTVDDFKMVIDKKCQEWKDTEWEKYLRPETLFGTKFESYLNAKVLPKSVAKYKASNYNPARGGRLDWIDDV